MPPTQTGGVETLGGYRIIRKLGSGGRADIFLGHAAQGSGQGPHLVAVKVYRPSASPSSIDFEIDALANIDIPHIVRLQDLASRSDGEPVLILQRLNPAGLDRLLSDSGALETGEAVTVLAPIAIALGQLHRSGFVHGGLTASKILFDDIGAPVMSGLGEARPIGRRERSGAAPMTAATMQAEPRVSDDLDRLAALGKAVLYQVANVETQAGARDLLRWLDNPPGARESGTFTAELAERLFALADAVPVRLASRGDAERAPARIPHREWVNAPASESLAFGTPAPKTTPRRPEPTRQESEATSWLSLLPLSPGLHRAAQELVASLQAPIAGARGSLRRVRKRVWLAAGGGVIAFAAAILLSQASGELSVPESTAAPAAVGSLLAETAGAEDAVDGADPLAAAEALLVRRQQCFTDRSVLCLDGVDQQNSAAWDTDQRRIRDLQQGAEIVDELAVGEYALSLLDRMGDTALIGVAGQPPAEGAEVIPGAENTPASILVIKTEAGWRIRGLLSEPR